MAGRFANTQIHNFLDNRLGSGASITNLSTSWIALSTTAINPDGTGLTEPVGNGYARISVAGNTTNWPAASNRTKSNGAIFTSPQATGAGWGTITHFAIMSASTAGSVIAYGELEDPVTVVAGQAVVFPVGSIVVSAPSS